MSKTFRRLAAFAVSAAMQGGLIGDALAQGTPSASSTGGMPPQYEAPRAEVPSAPSETTPSTQLPVLYVTSVEVLQGAVEPKLDIVRVTGLAASEGWTEPELMPTSAESPRTTSSTWNSSRRRHWNHRKPEASSRSTRSCVPRRPPAQRCTRPSLRECNRSQADPWQEPRHNRRQRLQRLRWKEICRRGPLTGRATGSCSPGGSSEGIAVDHGVKRHWGQRAESQPPHPDPR